MTGSASRLRRLEVLGLALLSYVPFLVSSPGNLSADTKPYLYLDPGRLLARSAYLWSDNLGTGTVPHQNIGYLFPMGPYYWAMDQLGVPDWVAQRLWMGSISFVAVLGALWLLTMLGAGRAGSLVGALVYMLTPYQLAFTARISVLLLPWAALPWLVGLTARALARRGWRDPALFALIALAAGSINASSFLLVGLAPLLWLVVAVAQRRASIGVAAATAGRIAVLTFGVSLWWAVGLALQARYGFSVLEATETLARVSGSTLPADLLRGFGNWFLSGSDRLGPWLVQAADYRTEKLLTAATLGVPLLALAAAACLRWRHRAFFVVLVVVGVLAGVGAWPYDHPSPVGSLFKSLANGSAFGLALRNTPRVVPVIVLGLAGLVAAGVGALATRPRLRVLVAGTVVGCVVVGFAPVWRHGYLADGLERPEAVPRYWEDAATALDAEGNETRVLEIPGSLFAAYRWGNSVEPVTPGLIDRPYVARELLAYGTPASVNLLAALDRRVQEGTLDAAALAPMARILRVGTIAVRSDLEYERYDTPRPRVLWRWLTDPLPPGLGAPVELGPTTPNRAAPALPLFDALELGSTGAPWPPAVALFPVLDASPIVDTKSGRRPVVLSGDGDGIVDATSAGLLDGDQLVQYAVTLDDRELRASIERDADLVITDSARRRARRWDLLRGDVGATERAGQRPLVEDTEDHRLDQVPGMTDADRTVVEQRGARVDATVYGTGAGYRPEDRPALALDDDVTTVWRVPPGVSDTRLVIRPDAPVRTDRIGIVQATGSADPAVSSVQLTFDGGAPVTVDLDDRSRSPEGQEVKFSERTVHRLEIELLGADGAPGPGGGLAEVRLGDVRVREVVRVPTRTLVRAGNEERERRVNIVLTRERQLAESGRGDGEAALARSLRLPSARTFSLAGTARPAPSASDDLLDAVLGTTASATFTSSGRLANLPDARASRAFDGDPA
ncbi:MAG: alpha-(1-_3)-arabinofuranosyltransferase family protein, partial [Acidimicrobiia bacterium]